VVVDAQVGVVAASHRRDEGLNGVEFPGVTNQVCPASAIAFDAGGVSEPPKG
jgi:hypothetical protein